MWKCQKVQIKDILKNLSRIRTFKDLNRKELSVLLLLLTWTSCYSRVYTVYAIAIRSIDVDAGQERNKTSSASSLVIEFFVQSNKVLPVLFQTGCKDDKWRIFRSSLWQTIRNKFYCSLLCHIASTSRPIRRSPQTDALGSCLAYPPLVSSLKLSLYLK